MKPKLKKKFMTKKDLIVMLTLNIILALYIIIIGVVMGTNTIDGTTHDMFIFGWKTPTGLVLLIMFLLEIISTITFQLRIYLTSINRIQTAATIGAMSWLIAGVQGMILINGTLIGMNDLVAFSIKLLPVGIATYLGIYFNYIFSKRIELKKKVEQDGLSR